MLDTGGDISAPWSGREADARIVWATVVLASLVEYLIGSKIGEKPDRNNALTSIREARLPKVVEE